MQTLTRFLIISSKTCLPLAVALVFAIPRYASAKATIVKPPQLVQVGKSWSIKLRVGGDFLALANPKSAEPAHIPVSLHPGRWLSGRMKSDGWVDVPLDEEEITGLLPGQNPMMLQAPGLHFVKTSVDASPLFAVDADLRAYAVARQQTIDASPTSGKAIEPTTEQSVPWIGFAISDVPTIVSNAQPLFVLPVNAVARKLFILLGSATDDDAIDCRFTARCTDESFFSVEPLISKLTIWRQKDGLTIRVVDIDLGEMKTVAELQIEAIGKLRPQRILAITALGGVQPGRSAGLPPRIRKLLSGNANVLFEFEKPSLEGWEIIGAGWGTTDTVGEFFMRKGNSRYFADSKAVGGEKATGTILSPPFALMGSKLTFLANGHGVKNYYALIDAATGAELFHAPAPEKTGPFEKVTWDISALKGRRVRFKAVDDDNRDAYAWIAFDYIILVP